MNILKDFISLVINKLNTLLNNEITRATAEESRLDTAIQSISTELSTDYQKKLVAGDNITIDPDTNEISASGGGVNNYQIHIRRPAPFDPQDSGALNDVYLYISSSENIQNATINNPTVLQVLEMLKSLCVALKFVISQGHYSLTIERLCYADLYSVGSTFPAPLIVKLYVNWEYDDNVGDFIGGFTAFNYAIVKSGSTSWTNKHFSKNDLSDIFSEAISITKLE